MRLSVDDDDCPNSLFRQKEGTQGEKEEKAGGRRKGGLTGTPTPGADAPTGPSRSGVSDARNRRKQTLLWGSTPEEGQRRLWIRPILSR